MSFVSDHGSLLRRHSQLYAAEHAEKIPAEDVAREMELIIGQLVEQRGDTAFEMESVDGFIRELAKFAGGRAKRRRKLIEQIAAGDDLEAVSVEMTQLDADLPAIAGKRGAESSDARRQLDNLKSRLDPQTRLIFALVFEDSFAREHFPDVLSIAPSEVDAALVLVHRAAAEAGISAEVDRREPTSTSVEVRRERRLFVLAQLAGANSENRNHLEDPIIALVRSGDQSDDLSDAIIHLAECADCRARMLEGDLEKKSLVVMAIEAPRASQRELEAAAEESGAILTFRGEGRWTAVVDAENADRLKGTLERREKPESSVVTRLALASPVELPVNQEPVTSTTRSSYPPHKTRGMDASEVSAWAAVARTPKRATGPSPAWMAISVLVVGGAAALAYYMAMR